MNKLVCISDTHTLHNRIILPEGDIIVHSGDFSNRGTEDEICDFLEWYSNTDFEHKILVAGNHDWGFERDPEIYEDMCKEYGITYLNDSGITLNGIKFWGSPVQPEFCDWAFNRRVKEHSPSQYNWIKPHWDMIPEDTDVLVTHGPPYGVLDISIYQGNNCGCPHLLNRVLEFKPEVHIFGHIHQWHGTCYRDGITYVNASTCDEKYRPVNLPIEIEVKK
jgi:Icc-related predicted phosphoesterase